jgi:beta-lactamase regulating signal transducer with metallopeptidase domain
MSVPFLQLAPLATERVINAIPVGLLIAALAWLFLRVVERQNSGARFAVWFCTLLAVAGVPLASLVTKGAPVTKAVHSEITLPGSSAVVIVVFWILITALATFRILVGLWKLRRLRSGSLPLLASNLTPAIQEIVARFQNTRRVAVCTSSAVGVPTAIGFFRPAILLPDWVLQELSEKELKVVLLHEFAHLRRWDDWTNLAQKLVRTVFFFHPAVWWIERRLSLEREMACDEMVLAETENPQAYAECLVSLAEKSFVRRGLALAQAIVGHSRGTSLRLARILDGSRPKASRVFKPALGLVMAVIACGIVALPDVPRLIAFENAAAPTPVINAAAPETMPRLPKAAVIPAAWRTTQVPVSATATRKSVPAAGIYRSAKLNEVRGESQKQRDARPVMVRTSAHQEIPAPELLFVMRTTQYDQYGPATVSVCVWRVTVDNRDRHIVHENLQQEMIIDLL